MTLATDGAAVGPVPLAPARAEGSLGTLWLLIGCFTLLRLVLAATVPLLPEEAYYWTWSRYLAGSYFDHPPLASYAIAATTAVLGTSAFAIKMAAVLWSLGCNVLWMRLLLDAYRDVGRTAWTLLALNLTIVYEALGVGATPDGPLLFCWTGAIWALTRLAVTARGEWWYAFGMFAGLACISKYTGALLFVVAGVFLVIAPAQRRWLLRPQPYLAVLVAVVLFSPVLLWNAEHGWASLAFQSTRRFAEMDGFRPRYLAALVATQMLVVTPYLFVVALAAVGTSVRRLARGVLSDTDLALLLSGLLPLVLFVAVSIASNSKVQWLAPAWWSLICLGVGDVMGTSRRSRLRAGLASSALLLAAAAAIVLVPSIPLPVRANTWDGWRMVAARVDKLEAGLHAQGVESFVFTPDYRGSSMLWFFRDGHRRTYAQDILGERALQYDYFPQERALRGATGLFVTSAQSRLDFDEARLRRHFRSVELADTVQAGSDGQADRRFEIWRCTGYLGPHP